MSARSIRAAAQLEFLCRKLPGRAVGSPGNRAATDWFAREVTSFGFRVESPEFKCIEWEHSGAELRLASTNYEVAPSPYTLGCEVRGRLLVVDSLKALERTQAEGTILLIHGSLAKEQLMPKGFPFYNPDEHRRIVACLERKRPAAILAATGRDPGMAGGISPFPLIEDGDFSIPCAHMAEDAGADLAGHAGEVVGLAIRARRSASFGYNVEARKGPATGARIVAFAHIDAKLGTPGALDNAAGVVTLLLLAESLRSLEPAVGLELVALNGEDYYSAPGEQLFLRRNQDRFSEILLGINIDGAGDRAGATAFSLYGCPPPMAEVIRQAFQMCPGTIEGPAWYQSDHSLFLMHERPALAVTSARFGELWAEIAHTEKDIPEGVSAEKLEDLARVLREIVIDVPRLSL
jgi:aminopeptidase YwaD